MAELIKGGTFEELSLENPCPRSENDGNPNGSQPGEDVVPGNTDADTWEKTGGGGRNMG